MKTLLFTLIVLFIGLAGKGQLSPSLPVTAERAKVDTDSFGYLKDHCDYLTLDSQWLRQQDLSYKLGFRFDNGIVISKPNIFPINSYLGKDTVEIKDTSIHFIKIGDQVFEIKRSVELAPAVRKVSPQYIFPSVVDTLPVRWHLYNRNGITLLN